MAQGNNRMTQEEYDKIDKAVQRSINNHINPSNGGIGKKIVTNIIAAVISTALIVGASSFFGMRLSLKLFQYRLNELEKAEENHYKKIESNESNIRLLRTLHDLPPDPTFKTRGEKIESEKNSDNIKEE